MPVAKLTTAAKALLSTLEARVGPLSDTAGAALQKKVRAAAKALDIEEVASILLKAMPTVEHAKEITAAFEFAKKAVASHQWYRATFAQYPNERKAVIPWLL